MSISGLISRKTLTCHSEAHGGQQSWSWLEHMTYEEKLGKWVCSAIRKGSGKTLFLMKTDGKIENRARLFLNVHGDKQAMNTCWNRMKISILGGV